MYSLIFTYTIIITNTIIIDTIVINLVIDIKKEAKGSPNIIDMPFGQLYQEAKVLHPLGATSSFSCSSLEEGTGQGGSWAHEQ